MRFPFKLTIIAASIFSSSCSPLNLQSDTNLPPPPRTLQMSCPRIAPAKTRLSENEKPVIEVNRHMMDGGYITGDALDFKLYQNSKVEFDDCPASFPGGPPEEVVTAKSVCLRKETKIDGSEMETLEGTAVYQRI
jgi:hypothetical protein